MKSTDVLSPSTISTPVGNGFTTAWEPAQTIPFESDVTIRHFRFEAKYEAEPDKNNLFVREIEIL